MEFPSTLPRRHNLIGRRNNADRVKTVAFKRALRHSPPLRTSCLALAAFSSSFAILSLTAFATAALMDRDLRFLDPYRQPSIDEAMVVCAMEHAVGANEENDVIFLGGSSCRCGIDPRQLPMTGYNLGSHAGLQPQAILLTLRGYLAHHPAPKVVALCLGPLSFDFRDDDEWAVGMTSRFVADYGTALGEPTSAIDTATRFIRRGFGEFVTRGKLDPREQTLRGDERYSYRTYRESIESTRGFFAIGDGHSANAIPPNVDLPYAISDKWAALVIDLDRECERHGCRLLVFCTPLRRALIQQRDMTLADKWLAKVAADNPRVTVCGTAVWPMDDDSMFDFVHLNTRGVARFMPIVAANVSRALGVSQITGTADAVMSHH